MLSHEGKRLEEIAEGKAMRALGGKSELARVLGYGKSRSQLYRLFEKQRLDSAVKEAVATLMKEPISKLFPAAATTPVADLLDGTVILPTWTGGAQAGTNEQHVTDVAEQGYVQVPRDLFADAEAILPVFGNSMTPSYPPGAQLAIALEPSGFLEYGEVYVLVLKGKVRPLLKRVYESDKGEEWITLVSDNTMVHPDGPRLGKPMYPAQDIMRNHIYQVWEVIGDQKRRKNKAIMLRQMRERQHA